MLVRMRNADLIKLRDDDRIFFTATTEGMMLEFYDYDGAARSIPAAEVEFVEEDFSQRDRVRK